MLTHEFEFILFEFRRVFSRGKDIAFRLTVRKLHSLSHLVHCTPNHPKSPTEHVTIVNMSSVLCAVVGENALVINNRPIT